MAEAQLDAAKRGTSQTRPQGKGYDFTTLPGGQDLLLFPSAWGNEYDMITHLTQSLCRRRIRDLSDLGVEPKIGRKPPKSSILIGFSLINHPFWGTTIFGNTHLGKENISPQKTRSVSGFGLN